MKLREIIIAASVTCLLSTGPISAQDASRGAVLPFPPQPMAGETHRLLQDSTMQWR